MGSSTREEGVEPSANRKADKRHDDGKAKSCVACLVQRKWSRVQVLASGHTGPPAALDKSLQASVGSQRGTPVTQLTCGTQKHVHARQKLKTE